MALPEFLEAAARAQCPATMIQGDTGVKDAFKEVLLVSNGVVQPKVNILGRFNHAYQVRQLDGSDSYKIQWTLVEQPASADWIDIASHTAIVANGISALITGMARWMRAVKNSGTGVATDLVLLSMR